jgi:hypothetical protein
MFRYASRTTRSPRRWVLAGVALLAIPTAAFAQSAANNRQPDATPPSPVVESAPIFPSVGKEAAGDKAAAAALSDSELTYRAVAPCRIMDTREVSQPFAAGETRAIQMWGRTNFTALGGSASCPNLGNTPNAFVINIATTGWSGSGWLTFFPGDQPTAPLISSINYPGSIPGSTNAIANGVIVTGCPSCSLDLKIFASASTQVIIDIMGYFDESKLAVNEVETQQVVNPSASFNFVATCPSNAQVVGGGYDFFGANTNVWIWQSSPDGNVYRVRGTNASAAAITVLARARCLSNGS